MAFPPHTTVQLKVIQKPPRRAKVTLLLTSTVFKKASVTLLRTSLCNPPKHSWGKPPIQRPKIKPRSRKSQQKYPDKSGALNNCSETLTLVNTPVFSLHPASIFIREDCFISSHCLSEQVSSTFFLLCEPYLHPHCPPAYKQGQPPGKAGFLCAISCCSVLHSISSAQYCTASALWACSHRRADFLPFLWAMRIIWASPRRAWRSTTPTAGKWSFHISPGKKGA